MSVRALPGLYYELRNTLRSKNFWCYVTVCILMCMGGYVQGGSLDGAFGLLVGISRFSLDDISMNAIIKWLMPHLLLSVYIGESGERDMRMQRLCLPRYASLRSYWRFQTLKLLVTALVYYALIVLGAALLSWVLGNRMPKVSEAALSWHNLYSGTMPGSWAVMLEIVVRAAATMSLVGLAQLALAWLTGSQSWGMAAFAALMLVPLFAVNARIQRLLPCDMSMYMRGSAVTDGLSLAWVCLLCAMGIVAVVEGLCLATRMRTIIVS